MALVKLPEGQLRSGKIGASVWNRNKGGVYLAKKRQGNAMTNAMTAITETLSAYASSWRSLTEGQRQSWNDAARNRKYTNRVQDKRSLSGFQTYVKFNCWLANAASAPVTSAPAVPPDFATVNPDPATSLIEWSLGTPADNHMTVGLLIGNVGESGALGTLFASKVKSVGISNNGADYKLIGAFAPTSFLGGQDVLANWAAIYGPIIPGDAPDGSVIGQVFFKYVRGMDTGDFSQPVFFSFPVNIIT